MCHYCCSHINSLHYSLSISNSFEVIPSAILLSEQLLSRCLIYSVERTATHTYIEIKHIYYAHKRTGIKNVHKHLHYKTHAIKIRQLSVISNVYVQSWTNGLNDYHAHTIVQPCIRGCFKCISFNANVFGTVNLLNGLQWLTQLSIIHKLTLMTVSW